MAVDRLLPTQEAEDLLELTREIADKELAPRVEEHERAETYPEGLFATLGEAGLLGLPYPEEVGGGGQPYEVYLQVLEELAARWAAVAVATSVHGAVVPPAVTFGTEEQKQRGCPTMLAGGLDRRLQPVRAPGGVRRGGAALQGREGRRGYRITGTKAWITHGGIADFYALFARTGEGSRGVSCFLAPGQAEGLSFGKPEEKMGLHAIPTTTANWDGAVLDADRLIGAEGQGLQIAFSALDSGRLGHRRVRHGARAGRAGRRRRLRERALDVRQEDRRPPGSRLRARRHGRGRRLGPRDLPRRRPPPRPRARRTAARPAWPSSSPPTRP